MDDITFAAFPQTITVEVLDPSGQPLVGEAGQPVTVTLEKQRSNPRLKNGAVVGGRNAYFNFDAIRGGVALPHGLDTRFRFNGVEPVYGDVSKSTKGNDVRVGRATVELAGQDMTFKTITVKGKRPFGLQLALNVKVDMSEVALRPRGGAITL